MTYWDAFEQRQSLRNPFYASLGFHVTLTAVFIGAALWQGRPEMMGALDSAPGAVAVTTVDNLPFRVHSTRVNRVANETESQVPQNPKPEAKAQEKEEPDAVPIGRIRKKNDKKKKVEVVTKRLYQPDRVYTPNQQFSTTGARVYTPMFQPAGGGGGVGVGTSPFGQQFGAYADRIKQLIAEKWRSQDLDPHLNNQTVVVTFDIQKNGNVTGIRVIKGVNYAMDNSAIRAIQEASPLPPLPAGFDRNIANVEFHFKLQR